MLFLNFSVSQIKKLWKGQGSFMKSYKASVYSWTCVVFWKYDLFFVVEFACSQHTVNGTSWNDQSWSQLVRLCLTCALMWFPYCLLPWRHHNRWSITIVMIVMYTDKPHSSSPYPQCYMSINKLHEEMNNQSP